MRLAKFLFVCLTVWAQKPIGIGPDRSAGSSPGVIKYFDWYTGTPSGGCIDGANGYCVGHRPQGDFYYWTAWLPDASGLPVTSGLPIVGTINDFTLSGCSGNVAVLQLDAWNWSAPTASHITNVNCMSSYGSSPGASNSPAGWFGHLTSSDSVGNMGTWKSRAPFSKGGILYLPVERQISAGGQSTHDATIIMSPDSGKHWCNPYTWANRAGSPGCDSTNWQADGAAPKCDAPDSSHPCTNAGYLDSAHSSIMWKALSGPNYSENWAWINYGNQDGQLFPSGIPSPFDPNTNTCFMLMPGDGSVACTPNASILDISAWKYYTCPAMTLTYRCPASDPASWTSSFANRTPTVHLAYTGSPDNGLFINPYTMSYVREFGSYFMLGQQFHAAWAPSPVGPWTTMYKSGSATATSMIAPAIGYNVLSTSPPHVQLSASANSYEGGQGSPLLALWDLVFGKQTSGEAFQMQTMYDYVAGAGYQFSDGHIAGSFPRNGLVWAFDFLDLGANSGATNFPYFVDVGNHSAVISPCNAGTYTAPLLCGSMNPGRGTNLNNFGIATGNPGYSGHFNVFPAPIGFLTPATAPSAMLGNGSYSVVGVYRYEGVTNYRTGGIWSAGTASSGDNTAVSLGQLTGNLILDWNGYNSPRYHYVSNFTFPNYTNWYFTAVTVQAQTGGCGANCTPAAKIWVGGATTPGVLTDVNAGVAYTSANSPSTKTPNVSAGPFVIGINGTGSGADSPVMSYATAMVYSRALTYPEVQMMYRSMRAKMAARGVTLQ